VAVLGVCLRRASPRGGPLLREGGRVAGGAAAALLQDQPLGEHGRGVLARLVRGLDHVAELRGAAGALEGPEVLLPAAVDRALRRGYPPSDLAVPLVACAVGDAAGLLDS